jgi:hypothetical protein
MSKDYRTKRPHPRNPDKYVIGGEQFSAKADVRQRGQQILKDTQVGAWVTGKDFKFLKHLLEGYRAARGRAPLGIVGVDVERNSIGCWKGFRAHYEDGTAGDISYINAANALGGYDVHPAQVKAAMRQAVEPQIVEFRYSEIARGADPDFAMSAEVDHRPPNEFAGIVEGFLKACNASLAEIELEKRPGFRGSFLPEPWSSRFEEFHREHAVVKLLTEREHRIRTGESATARASRRRSDAS